MYKKSFDIRPYSQNIRYFSDLDQLPAHPVLTIINFSFHPGVDIFAPTKPESLLWSTSLELVSTIPGFQGLYWAPANDAPSQQIIVLIQWSSQHHWKLFQSSLGFSMLLGYISDISNRCIQLALPVNLSGLVCHLELVSFGLPRLSTTQFEMAKFKAKWDMTFSSHSNHATEAKLISACGKWLEKDLDSADEFFIGLLFWNLDAQGAFPQLIRGADAYNITENLESLKGDATELISTCTYPLNYVSSDFSGSRPDDLIPYRAQVQTACDHQLFKAPVKPKYNAKKSTRRDSKDIFHKESMQDAMRKNRIGCAPAGIWYPMGLITQHYLPHQPDYN